MGLSGEFIRAQNGRKLNIQNMFVSLFKERNFKMLVRLEWRKQNILRIILVKYVYDLCNKNHSILQGEMKENLNSKRDTMCFWVKALTTYVVRI